MSHRCLAAVFAVVALMPMFAAAQSTNTTEPPRTSWGAPDLQGVWDFRSLTPMQRPEELASKEFLTEEEAASLEQEAIDRNERLLNRDHIDHAIRQVASSLAERVVAVTHAVERC